jgi:hypothetical protein
MKETATRTAGTRGKPLEPNLEPIQPFSRRPRKVAAEAAVLALSDAELASVSVKLSDAAQETVQNAPAATVLTPAPEAILSPAAEAQSEVNEGPRDAAQLQRRQAG